MWFYTLFFTVNLLLFHLWHRSIGQTTWFLYVIFIFALLLYFEVAKNFFINFPDDNSRWRLFLVLAGVNLMLQGIEKKSIEGFVEKMKQDYYIHDFNLLRSAETFVILADWKLLGLLWLWPIRIHCGFYDLGLLGSVETFVQKVKHGCYLSMLNI